MTILLILVPVLNAWFVAAAMKKKLPPKVPAVLWNVILTGVACRAIVDQYSHPMEVGFLLYCILVISAPVISVLTFLFGWP